ncbi:hypothetical protein HPB51_019420 [Rhipicephalus microplus]|uniref:Uncharacterized protein n=1 Tax=Rhipicephalus microplus TaxID=6941 RepID=A0A9J6EHY2_RHIMP|nr:hypothetical protein HPB51_019420 [Rhipicephalus microplus]
MQAQKHTAQPAKTTNDADAKGLECCDPSEERDMSSVGAGLHTEEKKTGPRTAGFPDSSEEAVPSRENAPGRHRGRVQRRVRYQRLTDSGKGVFGARHRLAFRRLAAASEGSKETSEKGEPWSEGPRREKSGTRSSDGRRDAPDSQPPSEREAPLQHPGLVEMQMAHNPPSDLELLPSGTEISLETQTYFEQRENCNGNVGILVGMTGNVVYMAGTMVGIVGPLVDGGTLRGSAGLVPAKVVHPSSAHHFHRPPPSSFTHHLSDIRLTSHHLPTTLIVHHLSTPTIHHLPINTHYRNPPKCEQEFLNKAEEALE